MPTCKGRTIWTSSIDEILLSSDDGVETEMHVIFFYLSTDNYLAILSSIYMPSLTPKPESFVIAV